MKKLVISNSMLRSLCTCSTQAWLRTNGWSTSNQESTPARAGKDAHLALEAHARGASPAQAVEVFRQSYQEHSDKFLLEKDRYHVDNLVRILSVYFSANPLSALPYEVVETEKQIECAVGEFGGIEYVVSDKSDGLVRMKDSGDLWSLEHKTVSYIGLDYVLDYDLDSQISTHVEAWRQNGVDVKGVVLQAIQFNRLPDPNAMTKPKKGEPKPVTCRIPGHGKQKDCWQLHVKYVRYMFEREQEHIETWRKNTLKKLFQYKELLKWPIESAAQEGIFGRCGRCEFLHFCKGHRRNFEQLTKREREEGVLYSGMYA